jgi:hypothetical protein
VSLTVIFMAYGVFVMLQKSKPPMLRADVPALGSLN